MEKIFKYALGALMAVSVALVFWAVFTTPEDPTTANATAVGMSLYWGYALLAVAVVAALIGAAWDMVQKPTGIKSTLISIVAIVAIAVVAYFVASGHDYQIVDLNTMGYFEKGETLITDTSIIFTYVVFAGAIVAAIYSAVSDALK